MKLIVALLIIVYTTSCVCQYSRWVHVFQSSFISIPTIMNPTPFYNNFTAQTNNSVLGFKYRSPLVVPKIFVVDQSSRDAMNLTMNDFGCGGDGDATNEQIPDYMLNNTTIQSYNLITPLNDVASIVTFKQSTMLVLITNARTEMYPFFSNLIQSVFRN